MAANLLLTVSLLLGLVAYIKWRRAKDMPECFNLGPEFDRHQAIYQTFLHEARMFFYLSLAFAAIALWRY